MSNFTFLSMEQIEEDRLDVIEKRGIKAAITDFAIMLGGYVNSDIHASRGYVGSGDYVDRAGWYWTRFIGSGGDIAFTFDYYGDCTANSVIVRQIASRPALSHKIDRKKQLDELREALARESVGFGNETNSTKRDVGEIGKASPLVDWRKLLKEAINANVDWSYKNADIEDGVVTPHIEAFPRPETEIVLDTSGSIHETLLRNFLRECKNILAESKVKVGCFDTKFYGFNEIRNENDIENVRFQGGGGTDFNVAINAFSRRVENKIIFTDGKAPMPEKSMDAIWIVFGEDKIKPKGGKIITITRRQLERLCRFHDIDMSR